MPHTLTNEQIEDEIVGLQGAFGENRNRMSSAELRAFEVSGPTRIAASQRLIALSLEAARRGILGSLAARFEGLRMLQKDVDVLDLLATQREWVVKRGFLHDVRLVEAIEELLAFRRTLHRQVLTGEDELREYRAWSADVDPAVHPYIAGLRRGFALRGEPIE